MPFCSQGARRVARRAAALVLFSAVTAPRVDAQPACAEGTLATYLNAGFSCQLAGWEFGGFSLEAGVVSLFGSNVSAFAPSDADVTLRPFTGGAASGRRTFGFALSGFSAGASADGAVEGGESALSLASMQFTATALRPNDRLVRAGADLAAEMAGGPAAVDALAALGTATVFEEPTFDVCFDATAERSTPGATRLSDRASCGAPRLGAVTVFLGAIALLNRDSFVTDPLTGSATGTVERVTFVAEQVVPEPSTVVLVTGGLLALGVSAARRRRELR